MAVVHVHASLRDQGIQAQASAQSVPSLSFHHGNTDVSRYRRTPEGWDETPRGPIDRTLICLNRNLGMVTRSALMNLEIFVFASSLVSRELLRTGIALVC